ncbi:hypothetical protein [Pseudoteredinibacter isoporae]|uniref:hypothetical protein n=1 Tax=Pseudoteredinibacter isoporae TaxID=570281 RepID=UPI00310B648B
MKALATLLSLLYLPSAQALDPLLEAAEDDLIASTESLFKTHKGSLIKLSHYMLEHDKLDKVFLDPQGNITFQYEYGSEKAGTRPEEAQIKKLRHWLNQPGLIGVEKQDTQLRIPIETSTVSGNTLFSSLIYQAKSQNLHWGCQLTNGSKNFRSCLRHLEGNWHLYYSWSYIPKRTVLKVTE